MILKKKLNNLSHLIETKTMKKKKEFDVNLFSMYIWSGIIIIIIINYLFDFGIKLSPFESLTLMLLAAITFELVSQRK